MRLAATCAAFSTLRAQSTNSIFWFVLFLLDVKEELGLIMLASAPFLASQTMPLRNMNTWEACCNWFPENKIPLERSAPCPPPLCTVSMRKLSVEVRPRERNSSHYFHHYQLQSTPILPYQVTLSAILSHSFPHIQHCDTHPVPSSPFNSVSAELERTKRKWVRQENIQLHIYKQGNVLFVLQFNNIWNLSAHNHCLTYDRWNVFHIGSNRWYCVMCRCIRILTLAEFCSRGYYIYSKTVHVLCYFSH